MCEFCCVANEQKSNFMLSQVFNKKSYTKNYLVQNLIAKLDDLDCQDSGPQQSKAVKVDGQCEQHGEELKLYCQTDKRPICVVCCESRAHRLVGPHPMEKLPSTIVQFIPASSLVIPASSLVMPVKCCRRWEILSLTVKSKLGAEAGPPVHQGCGLVT